MLSAKTVANLSTVEEVAPGIVIERTTIDVSKAPVAHQTQRPNSNLNGNGLEFNLIPAAGMSQQSIDGFTAAANLWSSILSDDIIVNINIDFTTLGPGILGSTGSTSESILYSDFRPALVADATSVDDAVAVAHLPAGPSLSLYTSDPTSGSPGNPIIDNNNSGNNRVLDLNTTVSKAVGLRAADNATVDADITFSSSFSWDFDRSDGITPGAFDFIGVAAHEIGHALGFVSGADTVDFTTGASGNNQSLDNFRVHSSLDLFRFSADSLLAGADIDVRADTATKFFSLDGGVTQLTTFSTGVVNGDGRQASHWKDNLGIGIMDPTASPGEYADITDFDIRGFDAIGWDVRMDFGDAPDTGAGSGTGNYATTLGDDGPRHLLFSASGAITDQTGSPKVFLGSGVSSDQVAQQNSTATADADDGVVIPELTRGTTVQASVTSTGGQLNYFVDFNNDGDFGDAGESFTATLTAGTQNVDIVVPADAVLGSGFARFRLSTAGGLGPNGPAADGEVEDYQVTVADAPAEVLNVFFSEYIEGTSNNKALEIFNAGTTAVDLSDFRIERYSNGGPTATNIAITGTLAAKDVFVIANSSSNAAILAAADATSTAINHNGDDAYILRRISTNTVYDMFGIVGNDPGAAWTDGGVTTVDATLRRKSSIAVGNPNGLTPLSNLSAEWDAFPTDDSTDLGTHDSGPGTADIIVTESGGSTDVAEGGATDSYTIVLATVPTDDVTVTVTPDGQIDLGSGAGVAVVLTFTVGTWDTPQTVTVTAVDDSAAEGNHTGTITHAVTSVDAAYDGFAVANVVANITDNDTPGVTIVESGGSTDVIEGHTTDTYTVVLDSVPSADVTITVTPDGQTSLGSGAGVAILLTFTPGSALIPQTVTVTPNDDAVAEGNHTSTITHTVASGDGGYNGLTVGNVTVNIADNDFVGLIPPHVNDFETNAGSAGLGDGWSVVSADSDAANTWFATVDVANRVAEVNGFGDTVPANDWLISPPMNLDTTDGEVVTFDTWTQFSDAGITDPEVRFLYSTDYSGIGDPTVATWTELPYSFPAENSAVYTPSGNIDVSGITGSLVWFAFQYIIRNRSVQFVPMAS
ncbi:MAG: NF038122 family metalloprotease [Planctomycetaceae bacterium]